MRTWTVVATALLAGCGTTIVEPAPFLQPADVQGVYRVCTLRFTPVQTALPPADLLASVIDTAAAPPAQAATLTLSGVAPEFEIVYTRRSDGLLRQVRGSTEYGKSSVFLYLTSQSPTVIQQEALLPPDHLDLVFHPGATRLLTAGDEVSAYSVRTSDYTRAAGISGEGLQDRITGHITASFSTGTCG